jgi:S1-C subfamily serine protease
MTRINAYGPSLIVLATTAAVLFAGPVAVRKITFHQTQANIEKASLRLESNEILEQINQAYRDIATVVEPSVVHISTEHIIPDRWGGPATKASSGSGWVYDEQGHIVTNNHVVEDASRIEVQLHDGRIHAAEVVGADPTTDIALLKIEPGRLHPAMRRDPRLEKVGQGDLVFAFGSPFDFRFSMSSGVVSGKGRSVGVIRHNSGRLGGYENFIQVDAAINPGNSGGPLTDFRGRVIGMNTAIATRGGGLEEGQFAGIGLAIPIEMIEPVVTQLIENDGVVVKGYLGVYVVDDPKRLTQELDMTGFDRAGVYVARVEVDSAAARAGLAYGDVITALNGRSVSNNAAFERTARSVREGSDVDMTVERYAAESRAWRLESVRLSRSAALRLQGVALLPLTSTVGQALDQLGFEGRGVRIARLELGGPAETAGMTRGDVVTHVNGDPVESVDQLRSLISSILPGQNAELEVWRYEPGRDTGRVMTLRVPLSVLAGTMRPVPSSPRMPELGIERMATATPTLADEWKVDFHPGVMILEMHDNAELREKIPAGSIVVEVAGSQVRNLLALQQAIGRRDLSKGVRIAIVTPDGERSDITVRVE